MEKNEFKEYIKKYLYQHGFEKIKNKFYRKEKDFVCVIWVFKSIYGEYYHFDINFFIGSFDKPYVFIQKSGHEYTPSVYPKTFVCEYLKYDEEQLLVTLEEQMNNVILPPFELGKKYLLDNFGTMYRTVLVDEKSVKKLLSE